MEHCLVQRVAVCAAIFLVAEAAYTFKTPEITGLSPKGIKFSYKRDTPDLTMMAFHFNINKALPGVAGSDYAADVNTVTDGAFVYIEPNVQLKIGDKVNYWLHAVVGGSGYIHTDQSYTYDGGVTKPPTTTTPKTTTTKTTTTKTTTSTTTTQPYTGPTTTLPPWCPLCYPCESEDPDEPTEPECETYPCLIFEENFDKLDLDVWEHEITMGGGGNWEFQQYTNNRTNSYVRDGILFIKPTFTEDRVGQDITKAKTELEIWGTEPANQCTGAQWWGCKRTTDGGNIVNPIQSARLRSNKGFSLRYGSVEIKAKMPRGDWIWPALWMLPKYQVYGNWPASGEIDMVESRGNLEYFDGSENIGANQFGSTLHYGPYFGENGFLEAHARYNLPSGETFNDDFHVFRMDWNKDGFLFTCDGNEVLNVETGDGYWKRGKFDGRLPDSSNPWTGASTAAPFDQEFYIVMNVAVGGTGGGDGYWKDKYTNRKYPKPWADKSDHASADFWSKKSQWYQTWPQGEEIEERAMQVDYIKVWKNSEEELDDE